MRDRLKDTHRKKGPSNKTPALTKSRDMGIWVVHASNHHLKLKQNFQKSKVVIGKTPFFVVHPFCTHHSICLNIGCRHWL